jgi:hypothetical protein
MKLLQLTTSKNPPFSELFTENKENMTMNQPHLLSQVRALIQEEECSPHMYNEFLNCESYPYNIQEK